MNSFRCNMFFLPSFDRTPFSSFFPYILSPSFFLFPFCSFIVLCFPFLLLIFVPRSTLPYIYFYRFPFQGGTVIGGAIRLLVCRLKKAERNKKRQENAAQLPVCIVPIYLFLCFFPEYKKLLTNPCYHHA